MLPIRRRHLFEFGDHRWLPTVCRHYLAEILQYQITNYNLYTAALTKLTELLQLADCNRVVDLCSGCGGALFQLRELLERKNMPVSIVLTDRFPDAKTIEQLRQNPTSGITYFENSVEATKVPDHLTGLRTFFTCFHHFKPEEARLILMNAVADKAPIGIFEFTERKMANIIGMLLAPIAVLFQSKRLTPFKWSRIFLTYLFPVIPLLYWWDGTVSHLRTYTVEELRALVSGIAAESYYWEIGKVGPGMAGHAITYLIGYHLPAESRVGGSEQGKERYGSRLLGIPLGIDRYTLSRPRDAAAAASKSAIRSSWDP